MNTNRLRQIAILVDSLDTHAADQLLEQLPTDLQQRVRDAVVDLQGVTDQERQSVLQEFRRGRDNANMATPAAPATYSTNYPRTDSANSAPTYSPVRRQGQSVPAPSQPESLPPAFIPGRASMPDRDPQTGVDWNASNKNPTRTPSQAAASQIDVSEHHSEFKRAATLTRANPATDLSDTLATVEVDALAAVVLRESPQVLAVVLSLLAPTKAAQLLELCPPTLQRAALDRLQYLTELDDEIVEFLQQELSWVVRQRMKLKQQQRIGTAALTEILVAAQRLNSRHVANVLQEQLHLPGTPTAESSSRFQPRTESLPAWPDEPLPKDNTISKHPTNESSSHLPATSSRPTVPLSPQLTSETPTPEQRLVSTELDRTTALSDILPRISFADLEQCDTGSLQSLLATAKPQLTLLALRGASQKFLERVLRMLPRQEAKEVEFRMQNLGPTRVQDIEQAQQYLLRLASLLEDLGRFRALRKKTAA